MGFRAAVVVLALLALTLGCALASAQGAKVRSPFEPTIDPDRDQPARREEWFRHGRVIPGESAATLRYRAHLQKMQMRATRRAELQGAIANVVPSTTPSGWTPLGPAPLASDATGFGGQDYSWVSGRATAVAVDSADTTGNIVYLGGAYGGLWKSTDAGPLSSNPASVTWSPLLDNQATLAVGAIAIQPQLTSPDPGKSVILVGTGETNSSGDSYYGLGILRSADAGNSWTLITQDSSGAHPFAGLGFSKIAFSSANQNVVVAAAAGATEGVITGLENPVNTNRGLYYSTDGGQSWNYAGVKDVSVTIGASSATSVVYNDAAGLFFAAVRWHGFYASSDGINWSRLSSQPGGISSFACPTNPTSQNCPIYRGELAPVPGRNEMYAWYVDSSDQDGGIWKTTDGGNTWLQIDDTNIIHCGDFLGGCGTAQGTYNLELAAVPNATATDLYAGAINLYKCTITASSPRCSGSGSNTFLNLTHVYGCAPNFGSNAHVHPDQHGLAFALVNNNAQDVMYFANDGGIYRALDGFSGLTNGSCGGSNQFDSLNQSLGSMTQFVSFAQHPSDPNTILGGTQDNGSPATSTSQSGTSWLNVNAGDGGYNEISPDNPTQWFTANTDVSIQRCDLGVNCHVQDFNNGLVVSNATVGGDSGAFYTPYILDPQNSGELLVGTCRIWRGATTGNGFEVLTNDFETGGTGACTGSEVNLVRSLTAGGIKDTAGFSNVIYAGTDGMGPLAPTGGHIWVTPNADGGPGNWFDRTGPINPGKFPVSGVAMDRSDATGNTAYVAIMGFHVGHVWKTTNAGASWTNFTANLPDAPANAVLVDPGSGPSPGTVYVATDVGVFSSSTGAANWTEVGPVPGSPGFLPAAPVTALRMFNSTGTKKLRAATYGRGIWEFTLAAGPDFQLAVANNAATVFAGQTATFNGTLTALNGYASAVNLSCAKGATSPPATCSLAPTRVTPTVAGTAFSTSASGAAGDYFFDVQGAGTDANSVTRGFSLALHVIDFNLTAPAPASVTVNPGATSGPVALQVTAAGAFGASVVLSCQGLPAGAGCNFQPSGPVTPVSGSPVPVTLTISTGASTPAGTSVITINGSTSGGPTRKQNLSLTVTSTTGNNADYMPAISNPSLAVAVNGTATFNGTLTSRNGYNSPVNLSCGAGATAQPPTCNASPPSLTPSPTGTAFTVTASSDVAQTYNFNMVAGGTDSGHIAHSAALTLAVGFDFALNNNSTAQTIQAGQSASYNLDARPLGNGTTFPFDVTLSCDSLTLPALSTCLFKPPQVSVGSGDTNVILKIQTAQAIPPSMRKARAEGLAFLGFLLPLASLMLNGKFEHRSGRRRCLILPSLAFAILIGLLPACGGGGGGGGGSGQPGTPPGNYTITVAATSGSISHHVQVQLTVN